MLIDGAGRVLAEAESDDGIGSPAAGEPRGGVRATDRRMAAVPAMMAGMVGSRQGWREAPYVPCPTTPRCSPQALPLRASATGRPIAIVPGLVVRSAERDGDVIRGEETQVVGLIDREPDFAASPSCPAPIPSGRRWPAAPSPTSRRSSPARCSTCWRTTPSCATRSRKARAASRSRTSRSLSSAPSRRIALPRRDLLGARPPAARRRRRRRQSRLSLRPRDRRRDRRGARTGRLWQSSRSHHRQPLARPRLCPRLRPRRLRGRGAGRLRPRRRGLIHLARIADLLPAEARP